MSPVRGKIMAVSSNPVLLDNSDDEIIADIIIRKSKDLQMADVDMKKSASPVVRRLHRKVLDSFGYPVSRTLFRKTVGTPSNIKLPSISEKLLIPTVCDIFPQSIVMKPF